MESTIPISGSMGLRADEQMQQMRHLSREDQIKEASQQFESVLVRQFLKDSLKPMIKGYLGGGGTGSDVYEYFMIDTLATSITKGGGLGIANVMQLQLQGKAHPIKETAE